MSEWAGTITALISGGVGASVGAVGVALIQTTARRSESRAAAADLVSTAAGRLADRMDKTITGLEEENRSMRRAMNSLLDVMDELIPSIVDVEIRAKAHTAMAAARTALR